MTDAALLPRPIAREASRHLFTLDEALAMQAEGHFRGVRTQLLDGEIHVMPHDGFAHINYAMEIAREIMVSLPRDQYFIGVQTTLHLSKHNAPSPDIYVLSQRPKSKSPIPAQNILLVIEVADTSLRDDLIDSASRYARHGVGEFWVVDVNGARTHVHREPADGRYGVVEEIAFEQPLAPERIEGFALTIATLGAADFEA